MNIKHIIYCNERILTHNWSLQKLCFQRQEVICLFEVAKECHKNGNDWNARMVLDEAFKKHNALQMGFQLTPDCGSDLWNNMYLLHLGLLEKVVSIFLKHICLIPKWRFSATMSIIKTELAPYFIIIIIIIII